MRILRKINKTNRSKVEYFRSQRHLVIDIANICILNISPEYGFILSIPPITIIFLHSIFLEILNFHNTFRFYITHFFLIYIYILSVLGDSSRKNPLTKQNKKNIPTTFLEHSCVSKSLHTSYIL